MSRTDTGLAAVGNVWAAVVTFRKLLLSAVVVLVGGVLLFPLYILLSAALKTRQEYFADALALPTSPQFGNFTEAWTDGGFQTYMLNSAIIVGIGLIVLLAVSLLAAYALVQFDIGGTKYLLLVVIAGLMVPPQVLIAPLFPIMDSVGWINTRLSLIAVYVAFAIPFSVFFFRQYFVTLPASYAAAARLDGCSELQVFTRIYLPLSIPAITTVFVFQFVLFWNEFLYALLFITEDSRRTTPAGLNAFQGEFGQDFTLLAASVIIAAIPAIIVFLIFRKYFVQGFIQGQT